MQYHVYMKASQQEGISLPPVTHPAWCSEHGQVGWDHTHEADPDLAELVGQRVRLTYPNGYRVSGLVTEWKCPGRDDVRIYYVCGFSVSAPLTAVVEIMGTNGRYQPVGQ